MTKTYTVPADPFEIEYLESKIKYKDWTFSISAREGYSVSPGYDFEISVTYNRFSYSGKVYLDNSDNLKTMGEAIDRVRNFIHNELK